MKNLREILKRDLKWYLTKYGKQDGISYTELYDTFPFDGYDLTTKQKSDRVRSIWKRIKKNIIKWSIDDGTVDLDHPEIVEKIKQLNKKKCATKITQGMGVGLTDYSCPFDLEPVKDLPESKYVLDLKEINQVKRSKSKTVVFEEPTTLVAKQSRPKILIYDLETSPLRSYVWSLWKQNVNPTNGQLQSQKMILSWSAKWLYENEVMNDYMRPSEIKEENDASVTRSLWNLINQADIVIAHNAKGFDVKIMNTRFLLHGLPPPKYYQVIDTLLHARKRFKLESNKLNYIGQILNLGKKQDTGGFSLWVDCMDGSEEAMRKMVSYCDQDVKLLEAVYLKLRPWIMPHPNLNLITENINELKCPSCNSTDIQSHGKYTTYANVYKQCKCNSCNSTFRERKAIKIDKTNLTIPTPN